MELNLSKTYTFADYLNWNDGNRYELIKGAIFKMSPAPLFEHQSILMELSYFVKSFFSAKKATCKIIPAPFDVRLLRKGQSTADKDIYTVVQPDICVVCDLSKIDRRGCIGAPDLIVEILSTSTAKYDLNEKFDLYQESGVKEYWVVFPSDKAIMLFVLGEDEQYDKGTLYSIDDDFMLCSKTIEGLQIDLKLVFDSVN